MIKDRDIVVLSNLDWDLLWQANQELTSRLARAGNRVLYVENLGIRSPKLSDAGRVTARLGGWARSLRTGGIRRVNPDLHVCSPLVLPPLGSTWQRALNRSLFLPSIQRAAKTLEMRDPVLWTFLPTDTALDLIEMLRGPRSTVVYTCLADWSELAPRRETLERAERALLNSSDVVFAQGPTLAARCRRWSDRVNQIELGVSLEAFATSANGERPSEEDSTPAPLSGLPRPIVGYAGALHRHLDLGLAAAMASARPEWSWVYVGPPQIPTGELSRHPNVRLIGHVPHSSLAAYLRAFDVCIVPYRVGAPTETVLPTKVLEYLAVGKPVVSTPLPEVCRFDADRGVIATVPGEQSPFLDAIEHALETDDEELRAGRRRAVAPLDWGPQLERMSAVVASSAAR